MSLGDLWPGSWRQGDSVMKLEPSTHRLDPLLAGWIVLVAILYFAQFWHLLDDALAILRGLLPG